MLMVEKQQLSPFPQRGQQAERLSLNNYQAFWAIDWLAEINLDRAFCAHGCSSPLLGNPGLNP